MGVYNIAKNIEEWNINNPYSVGTIVTNNDVTYIAKEEVPKGINIGYTKYWEKINTETEKKYWVEYSTDEQIIGTWIDGKPLYEKTLIVPKSIGTGTNVSYAHNISNIDTVVNFAYGGKLSSGGIYRNVLDPQYYVWVHEINSNSVNFDIGSSIVEYLDSYIVIMQYTKTTD